MLPARRLPRDLHALEELLRDGQVRRAPALSPRVPRPLPTGFRALDAALGGGLARGQLHEIVGPAGAGGTALMRAALASATRAGENCALIDPGDSFDASPHGIDLDRLLWVRRRGRLRPLPTPQTAWEARFPLLVVRYVHFSVRPLLSHHRGDSEMNGFRKT